MVFMPPRHGKSATTSEKFPAYYLGQNPDHHIIATSYGDDLAGSFAKSVRAQMDGEAWPFGDVAAESKRATSDWRLSGWRGRFRAAGIRGGITGRGAHLLLIDDPIKTQQEADSTEIRQSIWDWYEGVARRRVENDLWPDPRTGRKRRGAIVLVMTRWHDDDLAGRLLKLAASSPTADQWTVIELPALAEEGDQLGRAVGEPLWPQKYALEEYEAIRDNTAPRIWSAQYQQRPLTDASRTFRANWMNHRYDLRILPVYHAIIQTCDAAWKDGVSTSYSVIATWGRTGDSYDLLDLWRDRADYPTLMNALRDNYWKWQPFGNNGLYIEDAASGQSALQSLQSDRDPRGIVNAIPFHVAGVQQYSFVESATPFFNAGRVRLPLSAPWLADWIAEHVNYPTYATDDTCITTAMALRVLAGAEPTRKVSLEGFGTLGAARPVQEREERGRKREGILSGFGKNRRQ